MCPHFQPGDYNPGPNPSFSYITSNREVAPNCTQLFTGLSGNYDIKYTTSFYWQILNANLTLLRKAPQNKPQEPWTLVLYSLLNFQEQLAGYPLFWFLSQNLIIPYVLSHFVWFAIVFLIIILWGYAAISSGFILPFMFHLYKINYIVPSSIILTVSPLHCVCL